MGNAQSKYLLRAVAGGAAVVLVLLLYGLFGELPTRISQAPSPAANPFDVDLGDPAGSPGGLAAAPSIDESTPLLLMPPPFGDRNIDFMAEGEPPRSEIANYCADANWSRMDLLVGRRDDGAFRVDEASWDRALTGLKAGLANWMSQCHEQGAAIEIVAAESGQSLATYDPRSGLTSLQ
jgi:hypothetical protein